MKGMKATSILYYYGLLFYESFNNDLVINVLFVVKTNTETGILYICSSPIQE